MQTLTDLLKYLDAICSSAASDLWCCWSRQYLSSSACNKQSSRSPSFRICPLQIQNEPTEGFSLPLELLNVVIRPLRDQVQSDFLQQLPPFYMAAMHIKLQLCACVILVILIFLTFEPIYRFAVRMMHI